MLENPEEIINHLDLYLTTFPKEVVRQSEFRAFINRSTSTSLYHRKNFDGHITASAFILNIEAETILLLHHKFLNRWLQPGGHVDDTDQSVLHATLREVKEETGIRSSDISLIPVNKEDINIPFDIDSHTIPQNKNKNELQHVHHDLRFVFNYKGREDLQIDKSESNHFQWVTWTSLENDEIFGFVIKKIYHLIESKK